MLVILFFSSDVFSQIKLFEGSEPTLFYDNFSDNSNSWNLGSGDFHNASISDGSLIFHYYEKGKRWTRLKTVSDYDGSDYILSFRLANLNGDASLKYRVYKSNKRNSSKKYYELTPTYGFIWGFKDWDNYNLIYFYNTSVGIYANLYYQKNGVKTTLVTNKKFRYSKNAPIGVEIKQLNGSVQVKVGETIIFSNSGIFSWFGNKFGIKAGAGSKVKLDYVWMRKIQDPYNTNFSELSLKNHWLENGISGYEGIYERLSGTPKYKFALKKEGFGYRIIYLSGNYSGGWRTGETKGSLESTATPNLFQIKWIMGDKISINEHYVSAEVGLIKQIWSDGKEDVHVKLFPNASYTGPNNSIPSKGSGTGFAISSNGYIATNYHVIKGASNIIVKGVNGDFEMTYVAKVIVEDPRNDLAILKIEKWLGKIPYTINKSTLDLANEVYALGYPLTSLLGSDIKFTDGKISSTTGFQNDATYYQHSAPIQPGNSGGPLFSRNGDLIAINTLRVNQDVAITEGIFFSVKARYLMNLMEDKNISFPSDRGLDNYNVTQQVKMIKKFVYLIEVN